MSTRRDTPDGSLWRLAVVGFNRLLVDEVSRGNADHQIDQSARVRLWKEIADVYEIFLVGSCGRALPSDDLSSTALKADESLELTVLNVLSDTILKTQSDAPNYVVFLTTEFLFITDKSLPHASSGVDCILPSFWHLMCVDFGTASFYSRSLCIPDRLCAC